MSLSVLGVTLLLSWRCIHKHTTDWLPVWCVQDPEGKPKKANIRDNRDGTYTVSYVPDMTGRYTITIKYGGDEIPYSPYRIHALPTGDASKCLVTGRSPPTTTINQADFTSSTCHSDTDAVGVFLQCQLEDTDWVSKLLNLWYLSPALISAMRFF